MRQQLDKNYNSLDRLEKWDDVTQKEIKKRLESEIGLDLKYSFLNEREGETLELLVDVLVPQEKNEHYIKISEAIDKNLASDEKGVRYGEDLWPREFYKKGLAEITEFSKDMFRKPVENLNYEQIEELVEKIMQNKPKNFLRRFLKRVLSDTVKIYYSHPRAWNEIGFPGPAYPEGYAYLECNKSFPWEPEYNQ